MISVTTSFSVDCFLLEHALENEGALLVGCDRKHDEWYQYIIDVKESKITKEKIESIFSRISRIKL